MNRNIILIIHWIARVLASLMAALIAFMFIGNTISDGIGPLIQLTFRESLMMGALIAVFLGLILGWKREKLGGWLAVGGMVLFYLIDFAFSGTFPQGPFFPLIALSGLLFLISGYAQEKMD